MTPHAYLYTSDKSQISIGTKKRKNLRETNKSYSGHTKF